MLISERKISNPVLENRGTVIFQVIPVSYYLSYCRSSAFSLLFCIRKLSERSLQLRQASLNQAIITMNQQQASSDSHWGERCSVKLDLLLSRVDRLTGMLFHLKGTFTVEDAALYLGITPSHLYKLVRKYDIPHSRPTNGRIFFSKEELDKWIKSRMVIEPEAAEMPDTPEQLHECYY